MSLSFAQAKQALIACVEAKITPLVVGPPGTAKTALIRAVALEVNLPCHELLGSNCDAVDIAGLPYIVDGVLRRALISQIQACVEAPGLLFLDELTCFVAGTLVSTPTGQVQIEHLHVDDQVISFDLDAGRNRVNRVTCMMSRFAPTVKVTLANGTTLRCTRDHRFFTEEGWVEAAKLETGTKIRALSGVQEEVRHDHDHARTHTRYNDEAISCQVAERAVRGACTDRGAHRQGIDHVASAYSDGSGVQALLDAARPKVSGVPSQADPAAECNTTAAFDQNLSSHNYLSAAQRARQSDVCSNAREAPGSVFARRQGGGQVLEDACWAQAQIEADQAAVARPQVSQAGVQSQLQSGNQRSYSSQVQQVAAYDAGKADDRAAREVDHAVPLHGRGFISDPDCQRSPELAQSGLHSHEGHQSGAAFGFLRDGTTGTGNAGVRNGGMDGHTREHCRDGRREVAQAQADEVSSWVAVDRIEVTNLVERVYDITVAQDHNFFASNVLVHNCVPPSVQAPLMRLLLESYAGGTALHPESVVIGAANRPEETPGGIEMSAASINRVIKIVDFMPTLDEIRAFFDSVGNPETRLHEEFLDFSATLSVNSDLLDMTPPRAAIDAGAPFASPRAWERGLRAYASYCEKAGVGFNVGKDEDDIGYAILSGAVGEAKAIAFLAIRKMRKHLPSIDDILRDPVKAKVPEQKDRQIAAVGLLARVADKDLWASWIYTERLLPEISAACARVLMTRVPQGASKWFQLGKKAQIDGLAKVRRAMQ